MESFLRYWLDWPIATSFLSYDSWAWPLTETVHFIGLILLIGGVGIFDLRILGVAKGVPIEPLRGLIPWGVFGFALCVVSGTMFFTGYQANLPIPPYEILITDAFLQWKLIFILFGGINLLAFYLTGTSRAVDGLGAGADAPPLAKVIAGTSLFIWFGVIYFGRLLPWGL